MKSRSSTTMVQKINDNRSWQTESMMIVVSDVKVGLEIIPVVVDRIKVSNRSQTSTSPRGRTFQRGAGACVDGGLSL